MNIKTDVPAWTSLDSKAALVNAIGAGVAIVELTTADPNAWGFFRLPFDKILLVGYADLGLFPVADCIDNRLLVGINELLACFDADTLNCRFLYRMPTVFHEFISLENKIIVRDEIGFLGISINGEELWNFLTSGPINMFYSKSGRIYGETIDGEVFDFAIPA